MQGVEEAAAEAAAELEEHPEEEQPEEETGGARDEWDGEEGAGGAVGRGGARADVRGRYSRHPPPHRA